MCTRQVLRDLPPRSAQRLPSLALPRGSRRPDVGFRDPPLGPRPLQTVELDAEIAAVLAEKAILDLRGPVLRVTGYDAPFPFWSLEDEYLPTPPRVVEAVAKLLAF